MFQSIISIVCLKSLCLGTLHKLCPLVRDAWVAQLVEHPTLVWVMILGFLISSPVPAVLTAERLEPASSSVALSLCPSPTHTPSLSKINKHSKTKKQKNKPLPTCQSKKLPVIWGLLTGILLIEECIQEKEKL